MHSPPHRLLLSTNRPSELLRLPASQVATLNPPGHFPRQQTAINVAMAEPDNTATAPAEETAQDMVVATTNEDGAEGKKVVKKIIRKKKRPARVQMDTSEITSDAPPQTGTTYNIWYNKWAGGDREAYDQTKARSRCNIANDSGYTAADKITGSFFCLQFARGQCSKGRDCPYLHRLPGTFDMFNPNVDCFGREKFSDYRDDMGGVGSFMRQNRTVYIGRIHVTDDIEEIVARHFAEWGQIERGKLATARMPSKPG